MASRSAPRIRAVFFDAGNTLLSMNYGAMAGALARHGIRVSPTEVEQAEWRARVALDEALFARPGSSTEGRPVGARYVELILAHLGVRDPAVVRAVDDWRQAYNPPVGLWNLASPPAQAALAEARRAGLRAAVISNSNGSVRSILEELGLAEHLEFVLDSSLVGAEKPDPRIFRLALDRAGLEPAEAVYVGDLYSVDVLGARAVGIEAVLLDPGEHWGRRDCPTAPDVLGAVRLVVGGRLSRPAASRRSSGAAPRRSRASSPRSRRPSSPRTGG